MTSENDRPAPPSSSRCALCDEADPLTWAELANGDGSTKRVALCSSCFLDLRDDQHDDDE